MSVLVVPLTGGTLNVAAADQAFSLADGVAFDLADIFSEGSETARSKGDRLYAKIAGVAQPGPNGVIEAVLAVILPDGSSQKVEETRLVVGAGPKLITSPRWVPVRLTSGVVAFQLFGRATTATGSFTQAAAILRVGGRVGV